MRGLTRIINGNGEHQARVSDELRQLKLMSKGLRTQSLRALLERQAAQRREIKRLDAKPGLLPAAKAPTSVAA